MDVLSSQPTWRACHGHAAARQITKISHDDDAPGTISARVFIIGAAAGLAIATAKRLGARVDAFDMRPVAEQVQSSGQNSGNRPGDTCMDQGYARSSRRSSQRSSGREAAIAQADVVVTKAQGLGRPSSALSARIWSRVRPGSVIDMAVETGGNVEGSKAGEVVDVNGVKIIGLGNLPRRSRPEWPGDVLRNLFNLVDEFWDGPKASASILRTTFKELCHHPRWRAPSIETIKNL